ncbi:MAG: PDZ domain-containing protein [Fimbriimonadales bacterium]
MHRLSVLGVLLGALATAAGADADATNPAQSERPTMSNTRGYYRFPTIHGDTVAFACEDDLWTVSVSGGYARRLTTSLSEVATPRFSPDGQWIAFVARDEGHPEVYVMPAAGGEPRRLTYQAAARVQVVGWTPDGQSVIYASSAARPPREVWLWRVPLEGGLPQQYPYGLAHHISFGPNGAVILGRHTGDPAWWKRYRGGTAGVFWIDRTGEGNFERFKPTEGNLTAPMWIGNRIYFVSDHEGIANIYSCTPDGGDLQRHTNHREYYVRYPSTDGARIVYHAGADLYVLDLATGEERQIPVELRSPRTQAQRKFVDSAKYLQEYALHPQGHTLLLTVRGKPFVMGNWEGAVLQHGEAQGARYRLSQFLPDGTRILTVSDASGEPRLELHAPDGVTRYESLDIGHPYQMAVCPTTDRAALSNHRLELMLFDIAKGELRLIERSDSAAIAGFAWSPCGRWLAYSFAPNERTHILKIYDADTGAIHELTRPEFRDVSPAWDPDGEMLYFLSYRDYDPVPDNLQYELSFPMGMRVMAIVLRKDIPNPLLPQPRPFEESAKPKDETAQPTEPKTTTIDFEDIHLRVITVPLPAGIYGQVAGLSKKRVLATQFPVEGTLGTSWWSEDGEGKGTLLMYDFLNAKTETLAGKVNDFTLSLDGKTLAYRSGKRLRVVPAGQKPDEKHESAPPSRESGWIDLSRVRCAVVPTREWQQMYREAWRLQREFFWSADMSGVDWQKVYDRYYPLLERVATRSEFSDLMWEMQGELGTSHCYEFGGDYRQPPQYSVGLLGAEFEWDAAAQGYRITRILTGDPWLDDADSPLNEPGVNAQVGEALIAVNGRPLTPAFTPGEALLHQAGAVVQLTLRAPSGETRTVTTRTLSDESKLRYRDWVNRNRAYVHEKTNGQVGYIHIPDMGSAGFSEFHRAFMPELTRPALIVDVRANGGGYVSALLLEKLGRKRLGYDVPRWGKPMPYPYDSPMGPLVALTDERAGSDGDMFSHAFKLMKLGVLIGKRTWGGVIGISPKSVFVDQGLTTQPEYAFWFHDVGWRVENYGTDPDIEVDYAPQDYMAGRDPQLERAIAEIMRQLEANPPKLPDFEPRPKLPLP